LTGGDGEVLVEVFESPLLTKQRWIEIDQFEGIEYRRILFPIAVGANRHVVANIYANSAYTEGRRRI
jgi:hypothetical protein